MILGHQKQWAILKGLAMSGKFPHGLLFTGPAKLGKKTLAFEFIKLVNCQNEKFLERPCQICHSCQDIQKRMHPDFTFIEPINREIKISQVRELSWKLSLRPYLVPFKTAIIDQAHCLNYEAQSAFLKTLEEPKGSSLLILISEYPEILLPTVLSRVQELKFYPVKATEIEEYLIGQEVSQDSAKTILQLSLGRPGRAIDFLLYPEKLSEHYQRIKEIGKVSSLNYASRFQYAKDLSKEPRLNEILEVWLRYFRSRLISIIQNQEKTSLAKIIKVLKIIEKTLSLISSTNVNVRLALEMLMLEF